MQLSSRGLLAAGLVLWAAPRTRAQAENGSLVRRASVTQGVELECAARTERHQVRCCFESGDSCEIRAFSDADAGGSETAWRQCMQEPCAARARDWIVANQTHSNCPDCNCPDCVGCCAYGNNAGYECREDLGQQACEDMTNAVWMAAIDAVIEPCPSARDGRCDEGTLCPPGSDSEDCCDDGQPRAMDCLGNTVDPAGVCCSDSCADCYGAQDFEDASAACPARGGRLCSAEELQGGCTAVAGRTCSGCTDDAVWIDGDPCLLSALAIRGSADRTAMQTQCVDARDRRSMTCCADTDLSVQPGDFVQKPGCDVWVGPYGCSETQVTLQVAVENCESQGARLCTGQEILDDCALDASCDDKDIWTSDGCECEVVQEGHGDELAGIEYRRWHSLDEATREEMLASPNYMDEAFRPPSVREIHNGWFSSDDKSNVCDNCGAEMMATFRPRLSGNHTFIIASDDGGRLWFGESEQDAQLRGPIARVDGHTGIREWTKEAGQRSSLQNLEPGEPGYFIKAVSVEGGGADHRAVAVIEPDGRFLAPIPVIYHATGHQYLSVQNTVEPCCIPACLSQDLDTSTEDVCNAQCPREGPTPFNPQQCSSVCQGRGDTRRCTAGECESPSLYGQEPEPHAYAVLPHTSQKVCSLASSRHAVQCCSPSRGTRAHRGRNGCSHLWVTSNFDRTYVQDVFLEGGHGHGGYGRNCPGSETLQEAMGLCEADGGRLCTFDEITSGCTENTGCVHDLHLVWTNEPCDLYPPECEATGCPALWLGDGTCDHECDGLECSYDGGDCESTNLAVESEVGSCKPSCRNKELWDPTACDAQEGCGWTSHCVVHNHECSAKSALECVGAAGCRFEYPHCVPKCPDLGEGACGDTAACAWNGPIGYADDFTHGSAGWTTNAAETNLTYVCGGLGQILGGSNFAGRNTYLEKNLSFPLLRNGLYQIDLDFIAIDTWDGEVAQVFLDGVEIWSQSNIRTSGGQNECGGNHPERVIHVSATGTITGSHAVLRVSTDLDSVASDEAFGIDNVFVSVGECESQCDSHTDETSCSGAYDSAGCTWATECAPTCSEYNTNTTCEDTASCVWLDDVGVCADPICGGAFDANTCMLNQTGCTWDSRDPEKAKCDGRWIASKLGLPESYNSADLGCDDNICQEECPDRGRQDQTDGGCQCAKGFYDSTEFEVHCWDMGQGEVADIDPLNEMLVNDKKSKNALEGKGNWKSQCLACPECIDCSVSGRWEDIHIKEGCELHCQLPSILF